MGVHCVLVEGKWYRSFFLPSASCPGYETQVVKVGSRCFCPLSCLTARFMHILVLVKEEIALLGKGLYL